MAENLPQEVPAAPAEKKPRRFPVWLIVLAALVGACIVGLIGLSALGIVSLNAGGGSFNIEDVVLSSDFQNGKPVDVKSVFKPSDTIYCTVMTSGVDGPFMMRWFYGDTLIFEQAVRTQNNVAGTYIQSNRNAILAEGKYHVDIAVNTEPIETVEFEVKVYHPAVKPPISVPAGHKNIEPSWFTEVPFAFDEVWTIDGKDWQVNEVKVILIDDTEEYFVGVVVNADDIDFSSASESESKEIARPVAEYALANGYVDMARELEIDGKRYDLDEFLFVILWNTDAGNGSRVKFTIDELTDASTN
jgi:hypothetical protein